MQVRLYATGMYLMPKFGPTIKEIRRQFSSVSRLPAFIVSDPSHGLAAFYKRCADSVEPTDFHIAEALLLQQMKSQ